MLLDRRTRLMAAAGLVAVSACSQQVPPDSGPIQYQAEACKALIATVMGHPPGIVNVAVGTDNVASVSYLRPSDQKRFEYRCRGDAPGKLTWAAFNLDGSGSIGRWRDEDNAGFSVEGGRLNLMVRSEDGSVEHGNWPLVELR